MNHDTRASGSSGPIIDFSAPNMDTIDGIQIKRLPPGEALGASDLTN
jgi:hypothetical protein